MKFNNSMDDTQLQNKSKKNTLYYTYNRSKSCKYGK